MYEIKEQFFSVKEAAVKYGISERRVQKLCELHRIEGAQSVSGVWVIPVSAPKPRDARFSNTQMIPEMLSLSQLCTFLAISEATGRNWVKLKKIFPTIIDNGTFFFDKKNAASIKDSILSNDRVLKSRRNKKFVSGCSLYKSYISSSSPNIETINQLVDEITSYSDMPLLNEIIHLVLADCAIKLICVKQKISYTPQHALYEYLNNKDYLGEFRNLIDDLLTNIKNPEIIVNNFSNLLKFDYSFVENEDTLGLIYISTLNIGDRKQTGSYYTPDKIVSEIISNICINPDMKILDPCCGTGNFLLKLPENLSPENIYAYDIDETGIKLARINMVLKFSSKYIPTIKKNIIVFDYLSRISESTLFSNTDTEELYDLIVGNPPWGYSFSDEYKKFLANNYVCASGNYFESFSLFIEQSLRKLKQEGIFAFILPESIMSVAVHSQIRNVIIGQSNIVSVNYLGNVFDNVQCPAVILTSRKSNKKFQTKGIFVKNTNEHFVISEERPTDECGFAFSINNDDYRIISKLKNLKDVRYLKGNAIFALGIVTGDNKKYVSQTKTQNNEIVLKGADIYRYGIHKDRNYIYFTPDKFQQVAPVEYYRAKEKLLYRFISNQLIFAYDNEQILSLNSCNILIPSIKGLEIKYILAVLNSRIAQFIFSNVFASVKVLRSHIESIPIPFISIKEQQTIISMVDRLISCQTENERINLYNQLDKVISSIFLLDNNEYNRILESSIMPNAL